MAYIVVIEKAKENCGRNQNKTYINVITEARQLAAASLSDWVTANPTHPWNDTQYH